MSVLEALRPAPAIFSTGIEWIDRHPWSIAVNSPVPGDDPCGVSADEVEAFQDVENEILKRGTLRHNDIRWDWLADEAARLLQDESKDLRLLSILVQSLPHRADKRQFPLAICLAANFFSAWGRDAHPRSPSRNRLAPRAIEAIMVLFPQDGSVFEEAHLLETCKTAANICAEELAEVAPDLGLTLAGLSARLDALVKPPVVEEESAGAEPVNVPRPAAVLSTEAPRAETLRLEADNERALKQSLVSVADFLHQLDPTHPLSYRLRRYATWFGITAPPPIRSGQRSVLQPVSDEATERYRSAVERGQTEAEIIQRLERTCHLQPFWFEGQWLAFQLAMASGHESVAGAIRSETAQFLKVVPQIADLSFSDGTPMLPKDVAFWLKGEGGEASASSVDADHAARMQSSDGAFLVVDRAFQTTIKNARAFAKGGDLTKALASLDGARASAQGMRLQTLWEVVMLESLSEWGMKTLASAQAERLTAAISDLPVSEWEPDLIRRLKKLK